MYKFFFRLTCFSILILGCSELQTNSDKFGLTFSEKFIVENHGNIYEGPLNLIDVEKGFMMLAIPSDNSGTTNLIMSNYSAHEINFNTQSSEFKTVTFKSAIYIENTSDSQHALFVVNNENGTDFLKNLRQEIGKEPDFLVKTKDLVKYNLLTSVLNNLLNEFQDTNSFKDKLNNNIASSCNPGGCTGSNSSGSMICFAECSEGQIACCYGDDEFVSCGCVDEPDVQ